jgi:ABC-2 type transport system permease protein
VVPQTLRQVMLLNPLAPLLELARKWVIDPTAPGPLALATHDWLLVVPVLIYAGVCLLAAWVFSRAAPRIAEEL